MGWRSQIVCALLYRFGEAADLPRQLANNPHYVEDLKELGNWREPPGEAEQQELVRLLGEEMASTEEELAYEEKANEERVAIEREACLAPQGETWNTLVRQEGSLDRSIDRKVRILMRLRKESASLAGARAGGWGDAVSEGGEAGADSVPANGELVEAASNIKLKERTGNVIENKGLRFESGLGTGNVLQTTGGYLHPPGVPWEGEDAVGSDAPAGALPGAAI
jgi:hypothetical protein